MVAKQGIWNPNVKPEENAYNWCDEPVISLGSRKKCKKPSVIDLFCGAGGFSIGFSKARFDVVLGLDIHVPSIQTFASNHPGTSIILGDIRLVSDEQIENSLQGTKPSVLAAGIPCQGFSLCNRKRNAEDDRNFLFTEFMRVAAYFRPPVLLIENVTGLVKTLNGAFVNLISSAMEDLGYNVKVKALQALHFGVPQQRERIFFLGTLPRYKIDWPESDINEITTVKDAISDLPPLRSNEVIETYDLPPQNSYQEQMRRKAAKLLNHKAPNHPKNTVEKIKVTAPGAPMYPKFTQRIRLDPASPSPTQIAGGIRPQFTFGHPWQPRGLSIRERCRLQSFPDHYYIHGGIVQGRVQTGNAVPPLLALAIAKMIMKGLKDGPIHEAELYKDPKQMVFIE